MIGGNETGTQAVSYQNLPSGMAERRVYQIQVVSNLVNAFLVRNLEDRVKSIVQTILATLYSHLMKPQS